MLKRDFLDNFVALCVNVFCKPEDESRSSCDQYISKYQSVMTNHLPLSYFRRKGVAAGLLIMSLTATLLSGCTGRKNPDASNLPVRELQQLDKAIANAEVYMRLARAPIDSMLREAAKPGVSVEEKTRIYSVVTHRLSVQKADTAIILANEALKLANQTGVDSLITMAQTARVSALTSAGIFNDAEREYHELEREPMNINQRLFLWQVGRQLYAYMSNYAEGNFEIAETFRRRSIAYDDSLRKHMNSNSLFCRFINAEHLVTVGNYPRAEQALDSLLKELDPSNNIYGMASYQMAQLKKNTGKERDFAAYMTMSATSDVMTGVREGLALFNLANWLYEKGEISMAFHYINFAMRQAMDGDARMRAVNIATMLPMIDETYRDNNRKSHDQLVLYTIVLLTLLIVVIVIVCILIWQSRRRDAVQTKLTQMTLAQRNHIANFIALCSTYYHKLNSLEMMVKRKIASGQTDELLKLIKSGRYSEDKSDDIFEIFDRSFMEIYPDFIEKINLLLRPEERFPTEGVTSLHIELRIYALVKMGITESTRIAQVLDYSVNTVYAYRNKMRNRAINRETFEQDVIDKVR